MTMICNNWVDIIDNESKSASDMHACMTYRYVILGKEGNTFEHIERIHTKKFISKHK